MSEKVENQRDTESQHDIQCLVWIDIANMRKIQQQIIPRIEKSTTATFVLSEFAALVYSHNVWHYRELANVYGCTFFITFEASGFLN